MPTSFDEATVKGGGAPVAGACASGVEPPRFRIARPRVPLDALLADLQRTADLPLERATTLPAEIYTDKAYFAWEVDHVLRPGWLCLAHVSQIPQPGDFLNLDVLGEPLIVVHGKDGIIRVLSRVCPHRAMDIMPPGFGYDGHGIAEAREGGPGCGHTRLFLCPYHHWSFELDGRLKACPEMQRAEGFCRDVVGLKAFRSEVWNGFLFVNFSGDADPLNVQYQPLADDIAGWEPGAMKLVLSREWDCPFNWKVLLENFMEPYHHLGAHCKTLQPLMPAKHTWTDAERSHSIRVNLPFADGIDPSSDADFQTIPTLSDEDRRQMSAYLGQPSFLLFNGPDRIFWYRIDPISPDRSRLQTTMLVNDSAVADSDYDRKLALAEKMLVDFHMEDMEVCTAVQRGFSATGFQRGRLSHLEMPIWLIQRYLAARSRGTFPQAAAPAQR
jgi:phenylpropionate dioxygenase-like ring-hydroxylating dioxygenase large terminal subunit